ncbi:site-2 protease family protein [Clostridium botulinum]|uniref:Putative metalloprotease n=1 Tax=Clostridium botulinum (strain Langeland / NCTC 10281 / Type F) TaxID=441772 RepID=A7GAQ0_CLOBL|nr:site-2 protease family protein [Clostridium botulinum]ABS40931.1 putative metalloprotease [Clostridium botulinum F str. Langeland]ADF98321.1 putative metalloprotease [Clostridium botulinum F str. 230613]MBD5644105.1 site-2 protease family protein [Clostridium botulinum]MBY6793323.1 site-2 protease family protein [Clostridium botulinum]MBY6939112.1 site-2 protease family protein [Clostridium botulinum]
MDLNYRILSKILIIPAILVGLTVHEFAHAYVADKLGDKTPKFQGRLTLNPFSHIDIIGFIMILLIGFGWAKPVQINPSALKRGYKDEIKVSVAGVTANIVTAFIFALLTALLLKMDLIILGDVTSLGGIIGVILAYIVRINCMLAVFNLMPIPGLDGFDILRDLWPKTFYKISDVIYRYQMIILLIFVVTPISSFLVGIPTNYLYYSFMKIAMTIF